MPNLLDHVHAFGGQTLAERPFDALDSAILTQIVYMPFEGLLDAPESSTTLAEGWRFLQRTYPDSFTDVFQRKRLALTEACAQVPRYAQWRIGDYENIVDADRETQFAACSFTLPSGECYLSFRGTDLSVAGWKEDLNMSFMSPVPAQEEAVRYVQRVADKTTGALMLGGHSKGGNLSMYAGVYVRPQTQARITAVYSLDGPGVDEKTLKTEGYARIRGRIQSFIPQSSVVGMLLCYHPVYTVVKSNAAGLLQHDALTWQVKNGAFVTMEGLDLQGRIADETLNAWISSMDNDARRLLVETLYTVVDATRKDTVDGLVSDWLESAGKMLGAMRGLDIRTRMAVRRIIGSLFTTGAAEIVRTLLAGSMRFGTQPPSEHPSSTLPQP